jgi:hypothetical protein
MLSVKDVVERSREKSNMLQGFGDTVLRDEALEEQLLKSRKHAAAMQSKLDAAFAKYHNDVQELQAKGDDLVPRVEPTELVNVPGVVDVFAFKYLEAVGARPSHLCDGEGTFPGGAELVKSFRVLDTTEDEITNIEGAFLDVAIVVVSDTLQVPC